MLRTDTEGGGSKSRSCFAGLYHFTPMLSIGVSYRGMVFERRTRKKSSGLLEIYRTFGGKSRFTFMGTYHSL